MRTSSDSNLSELQKIDLQLVIQQPIDHIDKKSRLILLNYLLGDGKAEDKQALENNEQAHEAWLEILEQNYLQANTWLKCPRFQSRKGEHEARAQDLAQAVVACLDKRLAEDLETQPSEALEKYNNSIIWQMFHPARQADKKIALLPGEPFLSIKDNPLEDILKILKQSTAVKIPKAVLRDLQAYLEENGVDLNRKYPPYGGTLLSYATVLGYKEVVELLLTAGADPNILDNNQNSPLAWSLLSFYRKTPQNDRSFDAKLTDDHKLQIVDLLLRAGSRVHQKDMQNQSPWDLIAKMDPAVKGIDRLYKEAQSNDRNETTPLMQDILKEIVKADKVNFREIIRLLQLKRAEKDFKEAYLNRKFTCGYSQTPRTLLEFATEKGELLAVKQLIALETPLRSEEIHPVTLALESAMHPGLNSHEQTQYLDIVKVLLQAGAAWTAGDEEVINNLIPLREDILVLMGKSASYVNLTENQLEEARAIIENATGIHFGIIKTGTGYQLQHAQTFSNYEYDARIKNIEKAFGNNLGIIPTGRSLGMGYGTLTLTIPSQIIPMILENDFRALDAIKRKQEKIRRRIAIQNNQDQGQTSTLPPLSPDTLAETRANAEELLQRLDRVMGKNVWKLVETEEEGWVLEFPLSNRESLDKSGFLENINNILGITLTSVQFLIRRGYGYKLVLHSLRIDYLLETKESILHANFQRERALAWNRNKPNILQLEQFLIADKSWINKPAGGEALTPLNLCIEQYSYYDLIEHAMQLVDDGANINQADGRGRTPLDCILKKAVFSIDSADCYQELLITLVNKGAKLSGDYINNKDSSGQTLLDKVITTLIGRIQAYFNTHKPIFDCLLENGATLSQEFITRVDRNKGKTILEQVVDASILALKESNSQALPDLRRLFDLLLANSAVLSQSDRERMLETGLNWESPSLTPKPESGTTANIVPVKTSSTGTHRLFQETVESSRETITLAQFKAVTSAILKVVPSHEQHSYIAGFWQVLEATGTDSRAAPETPLVFTEKAGNLLAELAKRLSAEQQQSCPSFMTLHAAFVGNEAVGPGKKC